MKKIEQFIFLKNGFKFVFKSAFEKLKVFEKFGDVT